jgi:hypothetical protein
VSTLVLLGSMGPTPWGSFGHARGALPKFVDVTFQVSDGGNLAATHRSGKRFECSVPGPSPELVRQCIGAALLVADIPEMSNLKDPADALARFAKLDLSVTVLMWAELDLEELELTAVRAELPNVRLHVEVPQTPPS